METGFLRPVKQIYRLVRGKIGTLPFWWAYILIALVLIAGAAVYVWFYGLQKRVETTLIANDYHGYPDNLWFLPDGTLVGSQSSPDYVRVFTWKPEGQQLIKDSRQSFNIDRIRDLIKAKAADDRGRSSSTQSLPESFTIAPDGSRVAYLKYGYVCVFNGVTAEIIDTVSPNPFDDNDSVTAVAFTDTGLLALARSKGSVEFRNPNSLHSPPTTAQTKLSSPSMLKPVGNLLIVVSTVNAAVVVLDLRSLAREVKSHAYPLSMVDKLVLAVSNYGRLAVGGGSRVNITPRNGDGDASIELNAYGDIRVLSFYDEDRVLAGGAFRDLYLLQQGKVPVKVDAVPAGVDALAINLEKIAWAGANGVSLRSHHTRLELITGGKIAVGICAVLLFGLAVMFFYDVESRRTAVMEQEETVDEPPALRLPAELPADLVEACAAGDCVLYAGAGLSAQSGMPIWRNFVHDLLNWAVENEYVDDEAANSFHAAIDAGDSDPVADSIISRLTTPEQSNRLNSYLRGVFLRSVSPSQAHLLLRQLKFSAVLTTNFDNLLERTYNDLPTTPDVYTPKDAERLLTALTKRDYFILKLYGTLDDPPTVMVAPAQYESAITNNRVFSQFMQTLFFSRTLLFVGASLEGIEAYLKGISLPREIGRKHYALIDVVGNAWRAKADLLERRYGIKVLAYTAGSDYAELQSFVRRLATRVSARQTNGTELKQATSRLRKVTLENIGPFDTVDVEFDGQMQVLLGDNGVGKSTILKAISVALCGVEAQPYADRLLTSGRSHARIILETDNNTRYITEIFRDSQTRLTEIVSNTARPLEAEGWLAVAFPPLRTTSWKAPKGPDADVSKSRPVADDVLPLVTGDVDPRLDKLKQWIVNLDYASVKRESRKGNDDNYRKLIEKVFEVISKVTEGMGLRFVGVESGTNRIIVKADNGIEMPLEALSQGTISLIGWLGVLLQRLYEVYDQDDDPTKRFALVLMDEIDAHMHPLWQRTLVNHLKEIFPNVQFIATTHSPLLIRGMPFQQVTRFVRDEKGRVSMPRIEPDMTYGYTDQLLTSLLFGLPSELDDTTERKKKRYYELFQKEDRTGFEAEYEFLKQELMIRIPPRSASYEEKHEEQLKQADLLEQMAEKLKQVSPQGGEVLKNRAQGLRAGIGGGVEK